MPDDVELQVSKNVAAEYCYGTGSSRVSPERRLWAAVVKRAIDDLFIVPQNSGKIEAINCQRIRGSARAFLFSNSPQVAKDRKFVFEAAGLEAKIDLKKLRQQADAFEMTRA